MSDILIVEDDRDIADLIAHYLERAGHQARIAPNGGDGLAAARDRTPDVIVLDLMLPGLDGLEICRALRADVRTSRVPIIMLTARAEESDRIAGLELGADDYVTKPFSPKELVARINAQVRRERRTSSVPPALLVFATLTIDIDRHVVRDAGREVHLAAKEFLLLQYLVEHQGRVLSRDPPAHRRVGVPIHRRHAHRRRARAAPARKAAGAHRRHRHRQAVRLQAARPGRARPRRVVTRHLP
jgi:DNA-binding response OmpR family regulator